MQYLYVDNFRGFTDTYIPIKDVNFFVGENSTGKTSILSLIYILGRPEFWLTQDFNAEPMQFGHFRDIISINSKNKKYFRVGVIECSEENDEAQQQAVIAFLMTFIEKEGLPIIHQYNYINEQEQVKVVFSEKLIKYKSSAIESSGKFSRDVLRTFQGWVRERDERGFKVINIKKEGFPFARKSALAFFANLIEKESKADKGGGNILPINLEAKFMISV